MRLLLLVDLDPSFGHKYRKYHISSQLARCLYQRRVDMCTAYRNQKKTALMVLVILSFSYKLALQTLPMAIAMITPKEISLMSSRNEGAP